jgi:hypothetical protein
LGKELAMKTDSDGRPRGLHLVTSAATPNALEDKFAYQIADGVLRFAALQDELAAEALSEIPDADHVAQLVREMEFVRHWLIAHGVKVRG